MLNLYQRLLDYVVNEIKEDGGDITLLGSYTLPSEDELTDIDFWNIMNILYQYKYEDPNFAKNLYIKITHNDKELCNFMWEKAFNNTIMRHLSTPINQFPLIVQHLSGIIKEIDLFGWDDNE